jgi:hypothetical protein
MAARDDNSMPGVRSSEVIVIVQPPDSGQGVQVEGRVLRVDRDVLLVDWGRTARDGAAQLVGGR